MSYFIYPHIWYELGQVPSARWELIKIAENVGRWNDKDSPVKSIGSDSIIDFLFNVYSIDEGADRVVGSLIFPDELAELTRFIELFRWLVDEWYDSHGDLNTLHEAVLPSEITDAACALYEKLCRRGLPQLVEDEDQSD